MFAHHHVQPGPNLTSLCPCRLNIPEKNQGKLLIEIQEWVARKIASVRMHKAGVDMPNPSFRVAFPTEVRSIGLYTLRAAWGALLMAANEMEKASPDSF